MNIAWYAVERFAEIATIFLNIFFLYRVMEPKVNQKEQVRDAAIFIIIRMLYYVANLPLRPYFSVFSSVIYAYFVFSGRLRKYIIWNVLAVVIDGIVDIAVISTYLILPHVSMESMSAPGIDRSIVIIFAKILLFLSYYLVTIKVDKSSRINIQDFVFVLLIPIACWTLLEVLLGKNNDIQRISSQLTLVAISLSLLLILISVVILYTRITADGKELARSKLQLRTMEMTQDHISQVKSLYDQLFSIRHDLRNHFTVILGYVNAKEYDALKEYLDNLVGIETEILHHTNNPILNILLSSRESIAIKKEIEFESNIMFPEKLPIDDVDLCILISNILDNAFEASQLSHTPRYIKLNARIINSYWVIACRNSVREKGHFRTSDSIESSKEVSELHGIGTRQIKEIAGKTGGFVNYKHIGYEFTTLVMLKLPDI